jgi:hypothetical protein
MSRISSHEPPMFADGWRIGAGAGVRALAFLASMVRRARLPGSAADHRIIGGTAICQDASSERSGPLRTPLL